MKLFNLKIDSTVFKSGVFLTKFGHKLLLYLFAQPDYVCKLEKIIARMHHLMHQGIFRPNYIFNNCIFFRFLHTKFPFGLFKFKSFLTSTSPVFWGSKL